jgi:hypothetical protein
MDGICLFRVSRSRFLKTVAGTNGNSTICEALPTQERAFIDTRLLDIRFSDINGFYANVKMIINVVTYAGIKLSSVLLDNGETPGKALGTAKIF